MDEVYDSELYKSFNNHMSKAAASAAPLQQRDTKRDYYSLEDQRNFYILSMGHRIQFLEYDTAAEQVNVTQYRSRQGFNKEHGNSTSSYTYELWNKELSKFETMTQNFYQFPNPEVFLGKCDILIVFCSAWIVIGSIVVGF